MLIAELSGVSICLHLANAHTFVLPVGNVEFFFFWPLSHLCSVLWMSHTPDPSSVGLPEIIMEIPTNLGRMFYLLGQKLT